MNDGRGDIHEEDPHNMPWTVVAPNDHLRSQDDLFGEIERRQIAQQERIRYIVGPNGPVRITNDSLLEQHVKTLETQVKELTRMVQACYDAPGMPGANAILEEFESDTKKIKPE